MKEPKHSPNQLKKPPLVSIIIPCFNDPTNVHNAIQSGIEQTYTNIEVIIIDDGSVPRLDIDSELYPANVRIFHQKNHGVARARNLGIQKSKGQFLKFLDADDEILPSCIETQMNYINSDTISFIGYEIRKGNKSAFGTPKFDNLLDAVFQGNIAPLHSGLYPREIIEEIGGFSDKGPLYGSLEDYDFHFKMALRGTKTSVTHEQGVIYHKQPRSRSSDQTKFTNAHIYILKQGITNSFPVEHSLAQSILIGLCDLAFQSGLYNVLFQEFNQVLKKLSFSNNSEALYRCKLIAQNRQSNSYEWAKKWWQLIDNILPELMYPTEDTIPPSYSLRISKPGLLNHKLDAPMVAETISKCLKSDKIYLWGQGTWCEQWLQTLHYFDLRPTNIIDSNADENQLYLDIQCLKAENIHIKKSDIIIICSKSSYFDILLACKKNGWEGNVAHYL